MIVADVLVPAAGVNPNAAPGAMPVPLSITFCGLDVTSSAIKSWAVCVPVPEGVNATIITQLKPTVRVPDPVGHVVPIDNANSLEFIPPILKLVKCNGAVPVLVKRAVCGGPVVPTS